MRLLDAIKELLEDRKYNRELYRSGKTNKSEVRLTTIGWRPDTRNKEDGFTPAPDDTQSSNQEYYKVIRRNGKGKS